MAQQKKARTKHSLRRHKYQLEDPTTVAAVQRVLEMLNANEGLQPPRCPLSRQLRVTDSPFPLKDGKRNKEEEEEDGKVNKAADEFIKKFYKNLMNQKSLESPYHMSAR
ncbi:WD repeat-containing protein 75 [Bienertia sinuspersici]